MAPTISTIPNTRNAAAAPIRTTRSGRRVPSHGRSRLPARRRRSSPAVEPGPARRARPRGWASAIVASIVLSPSSAIKNATPTARITEPVATSALRLLALVEGVAAKRPPGEPQECETAEQLDEPGRQDAAHGGPDGDRAEMDEQRRQPRSRRGPADARKRVAKVERHELALVAQLGDEDHGEAEQERVHGPECGSV